MRTTIMAAWLGVCVLELAVVDMTNGEEGRAEWTAAFSDDFERAELGPDWEVEDGEWRIENGRLVGTGTIMCTRRFPGSQRIAYDALTTNESPCDLSAVLSANERGVHDGAFFGFGSERNAFSKLVLCGKEVSRADVLIKPGTLHNVICERDGIHLRHDVDGTTVQEYVNGGPAELAAGREGGIVVRELVPLSGDNHAMVGLYIHDGGSFDNVRVFTRDDPAAGMAPASRPPDANMLRNPGFEELHFGVHDQPAGWVELRHTRADTVEVVTDAQSAHWGRRYLRVSASGGGPIQVHNLGPVMLTPGADYELRVWARSKTGADLTVEPGGGAASLTADWQEYVFPYTHPENAKARAGFYVAVRGGPAAVDDASFVPVDSTWQPPSEWRTGFDGIAVSNPDRQWPTGRQWDERVPVVLTEVMGVPAEAYVVALRLGDILRCFSYRFVSPETLKIVDPANPAADIAWAVVDANEDRLLSGEDYLLFRTSCAARRQRTYYLYVGNRAAATESLKPEPTVPDAFTVPSPYPHRLFCDIGRSERRADAFASIEGNGLVVRVIDFAGRKPTASLVAPAGATQGLDLQRDPDDPFLWRTTAGASTEDGVWKLSVRLQDADGATEEVSASFVVGATLWGVSNVRRVHRWDPPAYGKDRMLRLSAARNEREAFQVVVESSRPLSAVRLSMSDLVAADGGGRIAAANARLSRIEEVLVTEPTLGCRAGWYPDVLLPWKDADVPGGGRRTAWIEIVVPKDAPAGTYRGAVNAAAAGGSTLALPIELTVHDFVLPDRLTFTPVLGADLWATRSWYPRAHELTNPDGSDCYLPFDRDAVIEYAHVLARRGMTPFYYYASTSPYPTPWWYDPETGTAKFDFTHLDEQGRALLAAGAKYLFIGDHSNASHRGVGSIRDWKNATIDWSPWKARPFTHFGKYDTPEGQNLLRAWGTGMGRHLQERGWLDNAYVYIVDEAKNQEVRDSTAVIGRLLRSLDPPLRTYAATYGFGMYPFLHHTSALSNTGIMRKAVREEFERAGGELWGTYNRPFITCYPLSIPRITGAQLWFDDLHHYLHWATMSTFYQWLNAHKYVFAPGRKFVFGTSWRTGFGCFTYPWPREEPLPPGKTRAFAPSLRLEALRESIDDHEYLEMLASIVDRLPEGSPDHGRGQDLIDRMGRLVAESAKAGSSNFADERTVGADYANIPTHAVFVVDEDRYQALRSEIGAAIEAGLRE